MSFVSGDLKSDCSEDIASLRLRSFIWCCICKVSFVRRESEFVRLSLGGGKR